ncbi:MAG: hypothetical protein WAZ38_06210 [Prolixibacteraceae bacterium]
MRNALSDLENSSYVQAILKIETPRHRADGESNPVNRDEFDGLQHQTTHQQRPDINTYLTHRADVVNELAGIHCRDCSLYKMR